jgi:predicted alpha-1,6-mannanase (GH76 family)
MTSEADPAGADGDALWAAANQAAVAVNTRFGHRLMGLRGTWIGAAAVPPAHRQTPWSAWDYWWQAQYLDAVLDAGFRGLDRDHCPREPDSRMQATDALAQARDLLRGILMRNFGRFPNYFFDDMAWLALAAGRLNALSRRVTGRPFALATRAESTLGAQLARGHDLVLGGGIYWSRKRDFKNTPANGPAALFFARTGEHARARALADWLRAELFDPELGLYLDGVHPAAHPSTAAPEVERTLYTYNQGPILAALLELDHPAYVSQAAELIAAVDRHLTVPTHDGERPLRLEPGADGSLFTGILVRYLALAAADGRLPPAARAQAGRLVRATAASLPPQGPDELLSAAVQRWTIAEAAATHQPQ